MRFRKKKATRMRAQTTHGRGSMKKGRGAGNRGGRGNAGTGKRGDANKPRIWKDSKYFGKHGFKTHTSRSIKAINIADIEERHAKLIEAGLARKDKDTVEIDLSKLGYDKLLGSGKVTSKFRIKAESASKSAVDKIKEAGGEIIVDAEE